MVRYSLSYGASRVGRVEFSECFHIFQSFVIHTVAQEKLDKCIEWDNQINVRGIRCIFVSVLQ